MRAVLTGRITQRGDNITIGTELTDVIDNKQLWGEKYKRKSSDLMSLQRDIAGQIANNLRLRISGEEHNRMMKHTKRTRRPTNLSERAFLLEPANG